MPEKPDTSPKQWSLAPLITTIKQLVASNPDKDFDVASFVNGKDRLQHRKMIWTNEKINKKNEIDQQLNETEANSLLK
jgi:hypothetical protein